MQPQLDVGKLVGAASAPVALIIASSIFLGNLGAKYTSTMAVFRDLATQYRKAEERNSKRGRSLQRQVALYSGALRSLMRATFWLTLSIQSFIVTVVMTSAGVIFPQVHALVWVTGGFGLCGLMLLAYSVFIELSENHRTKQCISLEIVDFPELPDAEESEDEGMFAGSRSI